MELKDLEWTKQKEHPYRGLQCVTAKIPSEICVPALGIDPGVNFGLASVGTGEITCIFGRLGSGLSYAKYGTKASTLISEFFPIIKTIPATVEGAVYKASKQEGQLYGEANLAYIRFGFYLGLIEAGYAADIVPPATIRKAVFGNGRIGAWEIWPTLNTNAADAIGCALHAGGFSPNTP